MPPKVPTRASVQGPWANTLALFSPDDRLENTLTLPDDDKSSIFTAFSNKVKQPPAPISSSMVWLKFLATLASSGASEQMDFEGRKITVVAKPTTGATPVKYSTTETVNQLIETCRLASALFTPRRLVATYADTIHSYFEFTRIVPHWGKTNGVPSEFAYWGFPGATEANDIPNDAAAAINAASEHALIKNRASQTLSTSSTATRANHYTLSSTISSD